MTGVERVRRCRERRKAGAVLVQFEVHAAGIEQLVRLGWLTDEHRANREAIQNALARLVNLAAAADIRPLPGF